MSDTASPALASSQGPTLAPSGEEFLPCDHAVVLGTHQVDGGFKNLQQPPQRPRASQKVLSKRQVAAPNRPSVNARRGSTLDAVAGRTDRARENPV